MVFLNWKELPWYWYGFSHFWFAALMVILVPGLLAFVFGWFAFRSRVTGVYLSIITQAMTYALLLAFFRNDLGFGGNNGLTDFKDILGFNVQADATRGVLFAAVGAVRSPLAFLICSGADRVEIRQGAGRRARRREPHALPRLPGRELQARRLRRLRRHGRHRRRALRAAGRHHQSRRIRARQLDRGGHLGGGRRPRHARRADRRRRARQLRQDLVHPAPLPLTGSSLLGGLFVAVTLFLPKGIVGTLVGPCPASAAPLRRRPRRRRPIPHASRGAERVR